MFPTGGHSTGDFGARQNPFGSQHALGTPNLPALGEFSVKTLLRGIRSALLSSHFPLSIMSLTMEEPVSTLQLVGKADVAEDYNGSYRFAPIEEAQVSRWIIVI